jgi:hypothetical protein
MMRQRRGWGKGDWGTGSSADQYTLGEAGGSAEWGLAGSVGGTESGAVEACRPLTNERKALRVDA